MSVHQLIQTITTNIPSEEHIKYIIDWYTHKNTLLLYLQMYNLDDYSQMVPKILSVLNANTLYEIMDINLLKRLLQINDEIIEKIFDILRDQERLPYILIKVILESNNTKIIELFFEKSLHTKLILKNQLPYPNMSPTVLTCLYTNCVYDSNILLIPIVKNFIKLNKDRRGDYIGYIDCAILNGNISMVKYFMERNHKIRCDNQFIIMLGNTDVMEYSIKQNIAFSKENIMKYCVQAAKNRNYMNIEDLYDLYVKNHETTRTIDNVNIFICFTGIRVKYLVQFKYDVLNSLSLTTYKQLPSTNIPFNNYRQTLYLFYKSINKVFTMSEINDNITLNFSEKLQFTDNQREECCDVLYGLYDQYMILENRKYINLEQFNKVLEDQKREVRLKPTSVTIKYCKIHANINNVDINLLISELSPLEKDYLNVYTSDDFYKIKEYLSQN